MAKKKKKNTGADFVNGLSVFHDEKRTVYCPFFSKTGYIMTDENCGEYARFSGSFVISLLIFTILYLFTKNFLPSLIVAILYVVVASLVFYFRFIKKAPTIENYKKPVSDNYFVRQAKQLTYKRLWTIILGCIALFICLYIYGLWQGLEDASYIANLLCASCALIYSGINVYILILKKKNNYIGEEIDDSI